MGHESRFFPFRCALLVVALVVGLMVQHIHAQHPTGSIEGLVTDPTGAVIPNATVKLTEVATGRVISLTTNEAGVYIARNLLPGAYKVEIQAPGFQTGVLELTVLVGQVA